MKSLCSIFSITGPCFQLVHRIVNTNYETTDKYPGNRNRTRKNLRSQPHNNGIDKITKWRRKEILQTSIYDKFFDLRKRDLDMTCTQRCKSTYREVPSYSTVENIEPSVIYPHCVKLDKKMACSFPIDVKYSHEKKLWLGNFSIKTVYHYNLDERTKHAVSLPWKLPKSTSEKAYPKLLDALIVYGPVFGLPGRPQVETFSPGKLV